MTSILTLQLKEDVATIVKFVRITKQWKDIEKCIRSIMHKLLSLDDEKK